MRTPPVDRRDDRPPSVRAHAGRRPTLRRLTRYSLASVVAVAVSQGVFAALYALGAGGWWAAAIAYAAGVPPNYHLNRRWAWGRRGPSSPRRELAPYAAVVGASFAITTVGTGTLTDRIADLGLSHAVETAAAVGVFVAVNGVLWIGKYLIYDRWLFAERSRHHVDSSTRA